MRGCWLNRGLFAAAGVIVSLATASASLAADATGLIAPEPRTAMAFDLPVVLPDLAVAPENVLQNPIPEITGAFALSDSLVIDTGYNVDVARMLDRYAPGTDGFDGLFYASTALGSPYANLASGGDYVGLSGKLSEGLTFSFGQASTSPGLNRYLTNPRNAYAGLGGRLPFDVRYTNSVLAAMTWNFARWGGINLTATQTDERGGVLGIANPALAGGRTASLGMSAHVSFGGGWVTTASYAEGLTQLALRPGALARNATIRTEAFGVAVAKHGLFKKNDALGVSFAQPAPNFGAPLTTTDKSNELQFFGHDKLMSTMAQETDIELGYKTSFFGDSVALQANASYQMNYGGIIGRDSVSLLSKAKIKF
jgi:hypothetical protein